MHPIYKFSRIGLCKFLAVIRPGNHTCLSSMRSMCIAHSPASGGQCLLLTQNPPSTGREVTGAERGSFFIYFYTGMLGALKWCMLYEIISSELLYLSARQTKINLEKSMDWLDFLYNVAFLYKSVILILSYLCVSRGFCTTEKRGRVQLVPRL